VQSLWYWQFGGLQKIDAKTSVQKWWFQEMIAGVERRLSILRSQEVVTKQHIFQARSKKESRASDDEGAALFLSLTENCSEIPYVTVAVPRNIGGIRGTAT
jgi:hypothetical protein